jgi:hypothetical protein
MISIIICNRATEVDKNLLINIKEHIGDVVYEVISIDNSKNGYDIFQAYNIGVRKAQYPIICFMHDDILFHSYNWGINVINHFKDDQLGMLGVGGPRFLSSIPSIWWASNAHNKYSPSACQYSIDTERNTKVSIHQKIQPIDKNRIEVVALDGLFFCIRKSLFKTISFDEITYHGFHFYDLDISMQVRSVGFKIGVIYDVLLEHISETKEWYDGYHFGDADVYCPWDIINHVDRLCGEPDAKPQSYWINTSGNGLVKRFIGKANKTTRDEIQVRQSRSRSVLN